MPNKGTHTKIAEDIGECLKKRKRAREKVKRVDFSVLPSDLKRIEKLCESCNKRGTNIFSSEIVRAGIIALDEMPEEKMIETVCKVHKAKRGRRWRDKKRPQRNYK